MKKILIALALCLLMVGLIASPAFAAIQKVPLYHDVGGTLIPTSSYATFINDQGDSALVINLTLKGALPNTRYDVYLVVDELSTPIVGPIGHLFTNSKGNWGGQNEQCSFQYILPRGTYHVFIGLINGPFNSPIDVIANDIYGPGITVKITGN